MRPHLQNNQDEMDWRSGSDGRVSVLQVQSPEFTHTQNCISTEHTLTFFVIPQTIQYSNYPGMYILPGIISNLEMI
jgi:hypothetical protein